MSKKLRISILAVLIGWTALTAGLARADDPIPAPRYRERTRYFYDPERTQWAGYEIKECDGEITQWGELAPYTDFSRMLCD